MSVADHSHLHKHDTACEKPHTTEPDPAAEQGGTRRSKRTHPPSAKAVENAAGGTFPENAKRPRTASGSTPTLTAAEAGASPRTKSPRKGKGKKAKAAAEEALVAERVHAMDRLTETPSAFIRLLCDTKVEDFEWEKNKNKPIFVCNRDDKVVDVFKGLIRHNLQSVPVMTKGDEKYHSFIDLHDIVHWVVEHFKDKLTDEAGNDFWRLIQAENNFMKRTVRELEERPYSSKQKFHPVQMGFSLFSVFEAMWKIKGLRRVAIITPNYTLLNLHTQSQMIDFLVEHVSLLGKKAKKSMQLCPHFFKPVLSVKETDTAFRAFQIMAEHRITGVAVTDENGRLKGNISVRDLKVLSGDLRLFWRLQQTAKNFIHKLREEFQTRHSRPQRLVFARDSDTVEIVLRQLKEHKIHRVYLCDTRRVPIGVVSLRDMLGEILTEPPNAVRALVDTYRNEITSATGSGAGSAAGAGKEEPMSPIERIQGLDFEAAEKEPLVLLTVPAIPPPPLAFPGLAHMPEPAKFEPPMPLHITFVPDAPMGRDIPIAGGVVPHALPPFPAAASSGLPPRTVVPGGVGVPVPAAALVPGMTGVGGVALPGAAVVPGAAAYPR